MRKSTKILLLVTVVLAILAFFALNKGGKKDTVSSEDALFAVVDSSNIQKIILQQKDSPEVILKFNRKDWLVNDVYRADDQKMNFLVTFINKVQIKRPVYKEQIQSVKNEIDQNGITVSVYNRDEELKKYSLSFDKSDAATANAIMNGYANPYTVYLPGYDNDVSKIFGKEPLFWKDTKLFFSDLYSIVKVKVEFFQNQTDSYEIVIGSSGEFTVKGMPQVDSLRLYSYLQLFQNVTIKEYLSEKYNLQRDSLLKIQPAFAISLDDENPGKSNSIRIYYSPNQTGKIYALIGKNNELVLIKTAIFEYLLQKRIFFEAKKKE